MKKVMKLETFEAKIRRLYDATRGEEATWAQFASAVGGLADAMAKSREKRLARQKAAQA